MIAVPPVRSAWPVAVAAVALGAALFAVRPLTALDPHAAPALLAAIYLALFAVSVAPALPVAPAATAARTLRPAVVTAVGAGAVLAVRIMSTPVVLPDRRVVAIALGLAAAVAEEAYFRRLMHPMLARAGAAVAIIAGAVLFAAMHYPAYGLAAMPLDFGAGLLFAWQRWASGSWTIPAATHGLANLLASV